MTKIFVSPPVQSITVNPGSQLIKVTEAYKTDENPYPALVVNSSKVSVNVERVVQVIVVNAAGSE